MLGELSFCWPKGLGKCCPLSSVFAFQLILWQVEYLHNVFWAGFTASWPVLTSTLGPQRVWKPVEKQSPRVAEVRDLHRFLLSNDIIFMNDRVPAALASPGQLPLPVFSLRKEVRWF